MIAAENRVGARQIRCGTPEREQVRADVLVGQRQPVSVDDATDDDRVAVEVGDVARDHARGRHRLDRQRDSLVASGDALDVDALVGLLVAANRVHDPQHQFVQRDRKVILHVQQCGEPRT